MTATVPPVGGRGKQSYGCGALESACAGIAYLRQVGVANYEGACVPKDAPDGVNCDEVDGEVVVGEDIYNLDGNAMGTGASNASVPCRIGWTQNAIGQAPWQRLLARASGAKPSPARG